MLISAVSDFRGEFAALSAALIWAGSSVIYTGIGRQISPLMLNLTKGLVAITLIVLTLLLRGDLFPEVSPRALGLLLTSGAIGIGLGDTAFFVALNSLGARRTLLLEALAPPLAALLALLTLQELLPWSAWWGISLTLLGVAWVVVERVPDQTGSQHQPRRGLAFGVLAAVAQASGSVMSRAALADTDISPLWSTLVRLVAGALILLVWVVYQRRGDCFKPLQSRRLLASIGATAIVSTYLAVWLQQIALKYTATGIAQALSATSPLFVIPIALWLGEKVSLRAVLGVLIALGGVWILFQ